MGPSGIRRDPNLPVRTRTLANGAIVVTNAYEGRLFFGDVEVAYIKRLSLAADGGCSGSVAADPAEAHLHTQAEA